MYFFIDCFGSILQRAELTEVGSGRFILMGQTCPFERTCNDIIRRDDKFYNTNSIWMGDYLTSRGELVEGAEDLVEMLYGKNFLQEWLVLHNFWRDGNNVSNVLDEVDGDD